MPKHSKLSRSQIVAANELMRKCIVPAEDGLVRYINGQSDATIAEELGVTAGAIGYARLELYGKLVPATPRSLAPDQSARLADLEKRIAVIEDRLTALDDFRRQFD